MASSKNFRAFLCGTAGALAFSSAASAQARVFDIPAGDLGGALAAYARQSGAQIIYPVDETRAAQTRGVHGALAPDHALDRLLDGTGFQVRRDRSGAVAVYSTRSRPAQTGGLTLISTGAVGAAQAQDPPAAAPPPETRLEEIIVTAQKREQNLQDVPISITALGAAAIQANRIVDVRDLNAVAPNLTVRVASGGSAQANYSMRGLVTTGAAPGADKGISVYIDGVYLQSSIGAIFELADVERIEILKGPQGTLFGRNATGGAISIVTRNPTGRFDVHQELSLGNYSQFRTKTRVDLPQVGPISAAFTFVHSQRDGDVKNLGAGTIWDYSAAGQGLRTSPKRLGDSDVNSFAAAVKLDLLDNLDLIYKFDYAEDHFTPEAEGQAFLDSAAIGAIYDSQPNRAILTPIGSQRPDAVNNWATTPGYAYNWGHNLTATYHLTDQISIKNIFSYRSSSATATYQLDGLGGLVVTPAVVAIGLAPASLLGQPYNVVTNHVQQFERQLSNETQLNVSARWFNLTAGYIHFQDDLIAGAFEGVRPLSFRPSPGFVVPPVDYHHTDVHAKSDAVFVQVEGHVTSQLDLVGGWRLTRDDKKGVDRTIPGVEGPIAYRNTRPSYLVGVNYRPVDGVLTYAKYATGYISGGYLAGRSYDPETAASYEVGVKADLFDRRLRTNLALYDVKYRGLQFQTTGSNLTPPNPATLVLINGGDGKAKGFEWENTFLPMEGLTLTGNLGYTDFKYTSVDPAIGTLQNFLPINRPKWTATMSAQYETGEVYAGGHVLLRLDANYRSKTYLGYPRIGGSPAAVDAVTTDNSWIVNGRAALADMDVGDGRAQVALWARNIFDNRDLANVSALHFGALGSIFPGSFERARTFGVDVIFDF